MRKILIITSVLVFTLMGVTESVSAQCQGFGQKWCPDYLEFYHNNGQLNTATMAPGETIKLQLVFYRGHDYRVALCPEDLLGEVTFKVTTSAGEQLYSSEDDDMSLLWDFTMKKTQRLTFTVTAEGDGDDAMDACIAMAIGVMPSVKRGFN